VCHIFTHGFLPLRHFYIVMQGTRVSFSKELKARGERVEGANNFLYSRLRGDQIVVFRFTFLTKTSHLNCAYNIYHLCHSPEIPCLQLTQGGRDTTSRNVVLTSSGILCVHNELFCAITHGSPHIGRTETINLSCTVFLQY
jgi:hypothetical protein